MKKFLVILLALALVFTFAACGDENTAGNSEEVAETFNSIPLGGGLPDLSLDATPYGEYVRSDMSAITDEDFSEDGFASEIYYSEGSDTPYICVFRWAKDGMTLEETLEASAEEFNAATYQMTDFPEIGRDCGRYTLGVYLADGNFYYADCLIVEDGDDFVEVDFYSATEEIALGKTGYFVNVPVGYTDEMDEDCLAHNGVFFGSYSEDYYLPVIWIGGYTGSYEEEAWIWSYYFPDGLPYDEASYNALIEQAAESGWTEELNQAYYDALGCTYYGSFVMEQDGARVTTYISALDGDCFEENIINIGDELFYVSLTNSDDFIYGRTIADSLHTK